MNRPKIKREYNNAIYDLTEGLYNDIKKYVEYNNGFIDCQPSLNSDVIFGYVCYGGKYNDSVEEQIVYALKIDKGDLYACFMPNIHGVIEPLTRDDYERMYADIDNDMHWNYIGRDTDSVMFVPTIMNIAEFIEEYEN